MRIVPGQTQARHVLQSGRGRGQSKNDHADQLLRSLTRSCRPGAQTMHGKLSEKVSPSGFAVSPRLLVETAHTHDP